MVKEGLRRREAILSVTPNLWQGKGVKEYLLSYSRI